MNGNNAETKKRTIGDKWSVHAEEQGQSVVVENRETGASRSLTKNDFFAAASLLMRAAVEFDYIKQHPKAIKLSQPKQTGAFDPSSFRLLPALTENRSYRILRGEERIVTILLPPEAAKDVKRRLKGAKEMPHPQGKRYGYSFAEEMEPFRIFFHAGRFYEIVFQIACPNTFSKSWTPLDKFVQEAVWKDFREENGLLFLAFRDEWLCRLIQCLFQKRFFSEDDRTYFEQSQALLDDPALLEGLETVLFAFTPVLIRLIRDAAFDSIVSRFDSFTDYEGTWTAASPCRTRLVSGKVNGETLSIFDAPGRSVDLCWGETSLSLLPSELKAISEDLIPVINDLVAVDDFDCRSLDPVYLERMLAPLLTDLVAVKIDDVSLGQLIVCYDKGGYIKYTDIPHSRAYKALNGDDRENNDQRGSHHVGQTSAQRLSAMRDSISQSGYPKNGQYIILYNDQMLVRDGQHRSSCLYQERGDAVVPVMRLYFSDSAAVAYETSKFKQFFCKVKGFRVSRLCRLPAALSRRAGALCRRFSDKLNSRALADLRKVYYQ